MHKERVFVTGLGAVSAFGLGLDVIYQGLIKGESAIQPIESLAFDSFSHPKGAQVLTVKPASLLPDKKLIKAISTQDAYGIGAAVEAVNASGCIAYRDNLNSPTEFNDRTGIFVGSPGNKYQQQYDYLPLMATSASDMKAFANGLFDTIHPMWLLRILPNNVLAYVGIHYGFKGVNHNISNHAVSGMQALIEGFHAVQSGVCDRAVIIAYDISIEPQGLMYYQALGVIANEALYAYDARHQGTLLGDGAVALVIESETAVEKRQATVYAEILGGVSAPEGKGVFSIDENGKPLEALFQAQLARYSLNASDIRAVIGHANGNPKSDISEAKAIYHTFGAIQTTGFKWAMGHTLAASGLFDVALGVYSFNQNALPGLPYLNQTAKECQGLSFSNEPTPLQKGDNLLIVNRGFGGMNATMAIKRV